MTGESTAAGRYEWERLIRRVRIGRTTKFVALALATYADADGSRVRPGEARLAAVTELTDRAVRNALKSLRELGLIERVNKGGRHGMYGMADVYRLAIPVDLLDRLELLDVDERPAGSPLPAGTGVPVEAVPNRNGTTAQPERDDSQPERRRSPTGTPVPPTTHLPTTDQHNYQRDDHSEYATTDRARDRGKVIPLDRRERA